MENLHDQHRMFLQALMWKKICSTEEVITLHKKCHERNNVPVSDLKGFVEKINIAIRPMHMSIVKGIDEISEEQYYILVNNCDNAISRLSTEYKLGELELFKKIMNCIIESEDGKVTTTTIYNLSSEIKSKEVDNIIIRLSQDGWLIENEGHVYFSTRAIAELQHFLKEHYKGAVALCNLCGTVVFQGAVCGSCGEKFHKYCKNSYFTDTKQSTCPHCSASWKEH